LRGSGHAPRFPTFIKTRLEQSAATETHVPDKPILTRAGNPVPAKLKPVFAEMTPPAPGMPWSSVWPRPLPATMPPPDLEGLVTTTEYRYIKIPPNDPWPRFKVRYEPRRPTDTDAQFEMYLRDMEDLHRRHGFYLGLCQDLCTYLGNHETCAEQVCRRNGRCSSRRDEDAFDLPLAMFPPCVPLDIDLISSYLTELQAEMRRIRADFVARGVIVPE
jgi:hypothetical protein